MEVGVEVEVLMLKSVLTEHLLLPLLVDVLDNGADVAATHVVDVEVDVKVKIIGVAKDRLALKVLMEVGVDIDEVHTSIVEEVELLVLGTLRTGHLMFPLLADEVHMEAGNEVDEVHVGAIDEVEFLVLGALRAECLMSPLLANVLNDVDTNRVVDVEVLAAELLGVAKNRLVDVELLLVALALLVLVEVDSLNGYLVLEVLVEVGVEVVEVHVSTVDVVEVLAVGTILTEDLMLRRLRGRATCVAENRLVDA
eukprot:3111760-Amphidinium_carterae.2